MRLGRPCKVVCHTSSPQWLAERERLITGTKAAEMAGAIRPYKDKIDPAQERAMWFGQQKEPMVGAALRRFGHLRIRPFSYLCASTAMPGLGASYDFLAVWPSRPDAVLALTAGFPWVPWDCGQLPAPGELIAVEVKCRSIDPGWIRSWKFRLPKKATWQGEAQLAVMGIRFVLWAVHIDHAEIHLGLQTDNEERQMQLATMARKRGGLTSL